MIRACFTDGPSLIVAVDSISSNGIHMVRVEPKGLVLHVRHNCKGLRFSGHKGQCSHIKRAVAVYEKLHWWEPKKEIIVDRRMLLLQPEWRQVDIPRSTNDLLKELD